MHSFPPCVAMSNYGPALPPGFKRSEGQPESPAQEEPEPEEDSGSIGPALPPNFKKEDKEPSDRENRADEDAACGPALPPHLRRRRQEEQEIRKESSSSSSSDDDDDAGAMIGPLPPRPGDDADSAADSAAAEVEARARAMRERLAEADSPKEVKRETWMLELPEDRSKCFGLGPRQFSQSRADKGKRDKSWTETPEDRRKRREAAAAGKEESEAPAASSSKDEDADVLAYLASLKRDQEMEAVSKNLREKRGTESLMEQHEKKRRKKEKEEKASRGGAPAERRPFDRDVDLQANRFDAAQKEAMLKKARQLDDRFSRGAGSKYL